MKRKIIYPKKNKINYTLLGDSGINPEALSIAIISDPFSYNSFKYEFNAIYIEPDNWRELFKKSKPIFFLCESAWEGIDPVKRSWHHKIGWFKEEKNRTLKKIIRYCKRNNIPTIFYNKEDPVHFDKFIRAAKLFDHVFTTSIESVERYKKQGIKNVFPTMFAVQPAIINPIEKYTRTDDIIFAGSYFNDKPERIKDQSLIFDKAIKSEHNFVFYNRQSEAVYPVYDVPEKYKSYVKPALDYHHIDKAYKSSKYAININTVKESETMFSRRVFELLASGTYIISNESKAMNRLFGDLIHIVKEDEELTLPTGEELRSHIRKGIRTVLSEHTYTDRIHSMFQSMGYTTKRDDRIKVTVIAISANKEESEVLKDKYYQLDYEYKNFLLVNKDEDLRNIDGSHFIILKSDEDYDKYFLTDLALTYKYIPRDTIVTSVSDQHYKYLHDINVNIKNSLFPKDFLPEVKKEINQNQSIFSNKVFSI